MPSKIELRLGDCLDVMRQRDGGDIDLIFTSPPYNLRNTTGNFAPAASGGMWGNAALKHGYASHSDDMPHEEYVAWQKEVLTECWRQLSPTGAIFYNHKPRIQRGELMHPMEMNPGLPLRQIIIWNRSTGINYSHRFYLPTHEYILIYAKPEFRLRDKSASCAKDVWNVPMEQGNPHPAPFPIALPRIALQTVNALRVMDPFSGSGTTGCACKEFGLEFIGIEKDPHYLAMAQERIEAYSPPPPPAPYLPKPEFRKPRRSLALPAGV